MVIPRLYKAPLSNQWKQTRDFYLMSFSLRNFSEMGKQVEINDNPVWEMGYQIFIQDKFKNPNIHKQRRVSGK